MASPRKRPNPNKRTRKVQPGRKTNQAKQSSSVTSARRLSNAKVTQPSALRTQPTMPKPQQGTPESQPRITKSQPTVPKPQPTVPKPKQGTPKPQLSVITSQKSPSKPQPSVITSQKSPSKPQPSVPKSRPNLQQPQPQPAVLKPQQGPQQSIVKPQVSLSSRTINDAQYVPPESLISELRSKATKLGPFNCFYDEKQLADTINKRKAAAKQAGLSIGEYTRRTTKPMTTIFDKNITVNCSDPRRSCSAEQWKNDNGVHKLLGLSCDSSKPSICSDEEWNSDGAATAFWKHASIGAQCFPSCHSGDSVVAAGNKWLASLVDVSGFKLPQNSTGPLRFPKYETHQNNTNMTNIRNAIIKAWKPGTTKPSELDKLTVQLFEILQKALVCYCERAHTVSQTYTASDPIHESVIATSRKTAPSPTPMESDIAKKEGCMACTPNSSKPLHSKALLVAQLKYINAAVLWFNWVAVPELWPKFFMPFPQDAATYESFIRNVAPNASSKCLKSIDRASPFRPASRASTRTPSPQLSSKTTTQATSMLENTATNRNSTSPSPPKIISTPVKPTPVTKETTDQQKDTPQSPVVRPTAKTIKSTKALAPITLTEPDTVISRNSTFKPAKPATIKPIPVNPAIANARSQRKTQKRGTRPNIRKQTRRISSQK